MVWGKIVLDVQAERHLPIREVFYDEDMQVSHTFTFTGLKELTGKIRPSILHIVPVDKPNEFTEFIFEKLTLNVPIQDSFFNKSALKRHKR